jgi:hypothetical protein
MAAEKDMSVTELGLRSAHRMVDDLGVELLRGLRIVDRRVNRTSAGREAGAFFRYGREAFPLAAELLHGAHHAVMLAVPAAAWGQIGVGIGAKEGRDQHPAEDHRQRKCGYAAHSQADSIARAFRMACLRQADDERGRGIRASPHELILVERSGALVRLAFRTALRAGLPAGYTRAAAPDTLPSTTIPD